MFMMQPPLNVSFKEAVMEWTLVLLGIKLSSTLTKPFYLATKKISSRLGLSLQSMLSGM